MEEKNIDNGQEIIVEIMCNERNCMEVCPHSAEERKRFYGSQCGNCSCIKQD